MFELVRMLDQAPVQNIRALVLLGIPGIGMNAEVKGVEVIHAVAGLFRHDLQEPAERIGFNAAFDLLDAAVFNADADGIVPIWGDADIA